MWITLLGSPGTGKTTLGRRLEAEGMATYISGSSLLDEYISARRPGWKAIAARKAAGDRASPGFTHDLLRERVERVEPNVVAVLDGFPKSLSEVVLTEPLLPEGRIDRALALECRTAVCTARIARRVVCDGCGAVSAKGLPRTCYDEFCRGEYRRRDDDSADALAARRAQEPVELLVDHFGVDGRLEVIDAERSPEVVFDHVAALIGHWRSRRSSERAR